MLYVFANSILQCCAPEAANSAAWGILNAIFGWTNSATYGSVISYNVYWIFVMAGFILMRFRESTGRWPFMKAKAKTAGASENAIDEERSSASDSQDGVIESKQPLKESAKSVAA